MTGFKEMPEVGNPLYVVKNHDESKFIINRIKQRSVLDAARKLAASGQIQVHDIKHSIGKLTKMEKQAIKGGDKSVLYEKLGLLEEKDLKNYYAKFGIKKGEIVDEKELQEELLTKTALGKRRSRSRYAKRKEALQKEHFVNIYHDLEEQKKQLEEMDEEDKLQM